MHNLHIPKPPQNLVVQEAGTRLSETSKAAGSLEPPISRETPTQDPRTPDHPALTTTTGVWHEQFIASFCCFIFIRCPDWPEASDSLEVGKVKSKKSSAKFLPKNWGT